MNLIAAWRKKLALRSYVWKLPGLLRRDYGASSTYTPGQVRQAISRSGLNEDYSCYAISLFSDRESFHEYHRAPGEVCDYEVMRHEIAASHLTGGLDFTVADIFAISADGQGDTGPGSHHDDGGGHSLGH